MTNPRVRYLTRRLRHLERQLLPFYAMNREQLEDLHPLFGTQNWRVYVSLMECVGWTVNDLADLSEVIS